MTTFKMTFNYADGAARSIELSERQHEVALHLIDRWAYTIVTAEPGSDEFTSNVLLAGEWVSEVIVSVPIQI